jgi:hypothetical protein
VPSSGALGRRGAAGGERGVELDLGVGGCGGQDEGEDEEDQLLQGHKTSCNAIEKSVFYKGEGTGRL